MGTWEKHSMENKLKRWRFLYFILKFRKQFIGYITYFYHFTKAKLVREIIKMFSYDEFVSYCFVIIS